MSTVVAAAYRCRLLADLRSELSLPRHTGALLVSTILGGAAYGSALGAWQGPTLALYAAIKVPMLLIGTAAVTALFNWIVAALFSLPLSLRQTFVLSLIPLAIAAAVAASLAPALLLFAISLPEPGPAQRTVHNLLYLLHVAVLASAGLAGTSTLREVLLAVSSGRRVVATRIRAAWIAAYAFVGGELAWALRPFVGSVYLPVVFVREDALRGNVYEFIINDIAPHLWRSLT
jgi:hypothetical protein